MFPFTSEVVTAITLTVIGIIIVLYVIVLKRMGWLDGRTKETSPTSSFLCPYPECRKLFQKPIKLTDLAEKPPRKHAACPHCGGILSASPSERQEKPKLTVKKPLSREKPKLTIEDLARAREDRAKVTKTPKSSEEAREYKALQHLKAKPAEDPYEYKALQHLKAKPAEDPYEYKASQHLEAHPLATVNVEPLQSSKVEELLTPSKRIEVKPSECPHYSKNALTTSRDATMPEECYCCSKMLECFSSRVIPEQSTHPK